ncbi:ORF32 [Leucania separata nucleopolyhedrovirus]|uniref:ORF26 protein n=1 Tax=Leucania separata nucleopolyhedrovirus TaxID=1307956 RepID=O55581_NPVLS|nr:ORF32 [Leucania separata nucleopolyhedrovirus]AAR28796.1 ORF32 [Leucania separata nucleopolyhedrovirus]BAA24257.1 ORF26 [Leucania separata nucleopolyhedrovirus]
MDYTSHDLLKNTPYSSKLELSFDRYMNVIYLSKGLVPINVDENTLGELAKINFKIDPVTRYVSNILDYEFVVKDYDVTVVYVINPKNKVRLGTMRIKFNNVNKMYVNVEDVDSVELNDMQYNKDDILIINDDDDNKP